ncbi:hypothetical protein [Streptomyces sp. NPDC102437]|uniref:hypothetical protein n=1 Tax=Streptomyces sp. NPDC102437 TaxID=3366175 RepID=UPI0037F14476
MLREADLGLLRASLKADDLDVLLVPAVEAMPVYRHRFILVPDTCGLTTFTSQLFHSNDLTLRTYPGEAASYHGLDTWEAWGWARPFCPAPR